MPLIDLNRVSINGGTQTRAALNEVIVAEYADALRDGVKFPPVTVFFDGATHWLADGFHRYFAHKNARKASINVDIREGGKRDAVLHSVGANSTHGLRRTNEDKRRAVKTMLGDAEWSQWADREIARQCGVGHPLVAALRNPVVAAKQKAAKAGRLESDSTPTPVDNSQGEAEEVMAVITTPPKKEATVITASGSNVDDGAPDDAELDMQRVREEAEAKTMALLLASDDKLADLAEKNTQLHAQIKLLDMRIAGLQNSNNEYIATIKRLQSKLKKLEAA